MGRGTKVRPGALEAIAPHEWDFHFRSGRLCLDLLATVADREGLAFDRWRSPADLGRWCVEAGLLDAPPPASTRQLEAARELREATHRLLRAALSGGRPAQGDIGILNGWAERPALAPQLRDFGRPKGWTAARPLEGVLSLAAADVVSLLAEGPLERVRQCAAEDCSVWFLDSSRPGRRRWCSMDGCGNREKKAAWRDRGRGQAARSR